MGGKVKDAWDDAVDWVGDRASDAGDWVEDRYDDIEDTVTDFRDDTGDFLQEQYDDIEDSVSAFAEDSKDYFEDDLGIDLEVVAALGLAFIPGMQGYLATALGSIPGVSAGVAGTAATGIVSGAGTGLGLGTVQQGLNYVQTGEFDFEALGYAGLRGAAAGGLTQGIGEFAKSSIADGSNYLADTFSGTPSVEKFFRGATDAEGVFTGGLGYRTGVNLVEGAFSGNLGEYALTGGMTGQGALSGAGMAGGMTLLGAIPGAPGGFGETTSQGQFLGGESFLSYGDRIMLGLQGAASAEGEGFLGLGAGPDSTFLRGTSGFGGPGSGQIADINYANNPYSRAGGGGNYSFAPGQGLGGQSGTGMGLGGGAGASGLPGGITTRRIDTPGNRSKSGGTGGQSIGSSIPEAEFIDSDGGNFGSPGRGGVFGGLDDLNEGDQFVNTDELIASYAQRSLGGMSGAKS